MKRLALLAALGLWFVVGSPVLGSSKGADWTRPKTVTTSIGITAVYPRAWHATGGERRVDDQIPLVIWSRGAPNDRSAERTNHIPDGGVWIWLVNYGPRHAAELRSRPKHVELRDEDIGFQTCGFGFDGWNLTFADHGQTVQAIVGLGRGASKDDATTLLDRVVVGPAA